MLICLALYVVYHVVIRQMLVKLMLGNVTLAIHVTLCNIFDIFDIFGEIELS